MPTVIRNFLIIFSLLFLLISSYGITSIIRNLGFEPVSLLFYFVILLASTFILFISANNDTFLSSVTSKKVYAYALLFGGMISIVNWAINDRHEVIYSLEYYWDGGVKIDFRDNNTFRVENTGDMFGSSYQYGDFITIDSLIILKDKVYFELSEFNDTLIKNDGFIHFKLKKEWKSLIGDSTKVIYPET